MESEPPFGPRDRFAAAPGVIETDLAGELILLDPATQEMFSLNPTGRLVWRALADSALEHVVERVVAAFDVDRATATADVHDLVRRLRAAGLLLDAG